MSAFKGLAAREREHVASCVWKRCILRSGGGSAALQQSARRSCRRVGTHAREPAQVLFVGDFCFVQMLMPEWVLRPEALGCSGRSLGAGLRVELLKVY